MGDGALLIFLALLHIFFESSADRLEIPEVVLRAVGFGLAVGVRVAEGVNRVAVAGLFVALKRLALAVVFSAVATRKLVLANASRILAGSYFPSLFNLGLVLVRHGDVLSLLILQIFIHPHVRIVNRVERTKCWLRRTFRVLRVIAQAPMNLFGRHSTVVLEAHALRHCFEVGITTQNGAAKLEGSHGRARKRGHDEGN
jgi:hypothetical protein